MITLDAADLIDSLSTGSYSVTRRPHAVFVDGIAVQQSPSTLTITAAVYQATGRDLQRLPEERRSIATMRIFTTTRLYVGAEIGTSSEATYDADRITIDGVVYELQTVGAWPGQVGFYDCLAQAVG